MAEIFGLVTAAAGLFPLYGFRLVKDVIGASDAFKEVSWRVQSQINVFEEWRSHWDLDGNEWGRFKECSKENQPGALAIGHELALLSFTLCNASELLSKYGLKLRGRHRQNPIEPAEIPNPDTEKLLTSEASFKNAETLVDRLRERNDVLRQFSPPAMQLMQKHNIYYIISKTPSEQQVEALFIEGKRVKKLGQQSLPYFEIARILDFSNAVKTQRQESKEQKRSRDPRRFKLSEFRVNPGYKVSASQDAEMGLLEDFPV
ncbi:hypothetical protein yc1106_08542 [Curvularia clavata]|uniref:Uncharacterized protein n=1 Tax=Curvularia clavata TaxID=95742 RepID=A0A9Q8ZIC7_CURCL|nr:hypothetical protein yc1106_08542 [Curvularia clavata]